MMVVPSNYPQKKRLGGPWGGRDVKQVSLPHSPNQNRELSAESCDEATGLWGFGDSVREGAASLLPLLICTADPPTGRRTLLMLFPPYCECPAATWHRSAVRCAVIRPGLTDCQCRGLLLLMQMEGRGWVVGGNFSFPLPPSPAQSRVNLLWTSLSCFQLSVNNCRSGCGLILL